MLEQKWKSACIHLLHRTPFAQGNYWATCRTQRRRRNSQTGDGHGHEHDQNEVPVAVALLKVCAQKKDLLGTTRIHGDATNKGLLLRNVYVGCALINAYAKCGALKKARQVFDHLPARGLIAWTSLLAGYAEHGPFEEALNCVEGMQRDGFVPDSVAFVCVLKACGNLRELEKGRRFHMEITRGEVFGENVFVGNALVDMYAKCGEIGRAQDVFHEMQSRDISSWNVLVTAYSQHENPETVLGCLRRMQSEACLPDPITFTGLLNACSSLETSFRTSREIHARVLAGTTMQKNISVGNALVDMYSKRGMISVAHRIFHELPARDAISWNVWIAACVEHGYGKEAMDVFDEMQRQGFSPDGATFVCMLKACGAVGAVERGRWIHAEITKGGWMKEHDLVGNALVDMYVKCGRMEITEQVFEELPFQQESSWNTLISGYAQHGQDEKALACLGRMVSAGRSPDTITFVCVLKVCGRAGTMEKGEEVHAAMASEGLTEKACVGKGLVEMYAKCGAVAEAQDVFDAFAAPPDAPISTSCSCWNSLLLGYAQLGQDEAVFALFHRMKGHGAQPDSITFLIMLYACNHVGSLVNAQMCFHMMSADHGIMPTLQHYSCMVDVFARAGNLVGAMAIIKGMPFSGNLMVWHAVLKGCDKEREEALGRVAFEQAVELDGEDGASYRLFHNIIYQAAATRVMTTSSSATSAAPTSIGNYYKRDSFV